MKFEKKVEFMDVLNFSKRIMCSVGVLFFALQIFVDQSYARQTIVAVGEAELEKPVILFGQNALDSGLTVAEQSIVERFSGILKNDLSFYKHLIEVEAAQDESSKTFFVHPKYKEWAEDNKDYVVAISASKRGQGIVFALKLFSGSEGKVLLDKSVELKSSFPRKVAHEIADAIYQKVTGKKSFFLSEIVFIADKGLVQKNAPKELYIMDFDGYGTTQLTFHGGTAISPALSPDGRYIVYSLIAKKGRNKNIDLLVYDRITKKSRTVSHRPGMNSGAIFAQDGLSLYLTLSHRGNADIYKIDLQGKILHQITSKLADDVDPSINQQENLMAFLSGRSGKAMIHTLDPLGTEKSVKQIGFVGKFNATPRFSPDGSEIVFSSWKDENFDIFRIGQDGNNLVRLTKNSGSNEDPTFSSDGEFILFSSQQVLSSRKARQDLILMNRDGEILGNLTEKQGLGNCAGPRFSW